MRRWHIAHVFYNFAGRKLAPRHATLQLCLLVRTGRPGAMWFRCIVTIRAHKRYVDCIYRRIYRRSHNNVLAVCMQDHNTRCPRELCTRKRLPFLLYSFVSCEVFRVKQSGLYSADVTTIAALVDRADDKLFESILHNPHHVRNSLMPSFIYLLLFCYIKRLSLRYKRVFW